MILIIASNPFKSLEEIARKLALDFSASYKNLEEDFLLKNAGFFEEAAKGNFIYTGPVIAGKMLAPSVKVYLKESEEVVLNRIAKERKISVEDAKKVYDAKIKAEKERLIKFFGIELYNNEIYDLVLKTDCLDTSGIISVIEKFIVSSKLRKR